MQSDNHGSNFTIESCKLIEQDIEEREFLLPPIFFRGSLTMLHAWTGVGKTNFGFWACAAIAAGGKFLKWSASKAFKTLYLDGELGLAECQAKTIQITKGADFEIPEGNLHFLTPDLCPNFEVPNLADPKNFAFYSDLVGGFDFIVIDNYLSFCRKQGHQNDEDVWQAVQPWFVKQRVLKKAVLIVHHSGKGGSQLGTSIKEHILNITIHLRRPCDYKMQDGARFDIIFEKDRNYQGVATDPIEAQMKSFDDGRAEWTYRALDDANRDRVKRMLDLKMGVKAIVEELHVTQWQVKKYIQEINQQTTGPVIEAWDLTDSPRHFQEDEDNELF